MGTLPSLPATEAATAPSQAAPTLTVVMPVYNEQARVAQVVREWTAELERLRIDYRLCLYDDGSSDETPRILTELAAQEPRLVLTRHANRGHGPTILRGYREAQGEWVLQVDSDGELPADGFEALWGRRQEHDFLIAVREGRRVSLMRRLVTAGARISVRTLFGARLRDVNSPCRLMRRSRLEPLLAHLPTEPFAPNVLLVGLAARAGLRIEERLVPHRGRGEGRGSLTMGRLVRGVLRSVADTVRTALRARHGPLT